MTYEVELKKIYKQFGKFTATNNVSLGIKCGRLVGILGPSGSGKTTILRMIAGLDHPDQGDILVQGKRINDIAPGERGIGFVFQSYALFRHMTVYDNIAFGMEIKGFTKSEIRKRVPELIDLIGLSNFENRYPMKLSGGQRQRVAFARALAPNPSILLLDEPFAAIDAKIRKELRQWLRDTISQLGITSIFVTHDQYEAVEVADDIIIMNQGQVEQMGTPIEIYKSPHTVFVAQFIGDAIMVDNISGFKGFSNESYYGKTGVIRPEFIQIGIDRSEIQFPLSAESGRVVDVCFRGNTIEVTVNIDGVELIGHRSLEAKPLHIGDEVLVFIHRIYMVDHNTVEVVENIVKANADYVI